MDLTVLQLVGLLFASAALSGLSVFLLCRRVDGVAGSALEAYRNAYNTLSASQAGSDRFVTSGAHKLLELASAMNAGQTQVMTELAGVIARDYGGQALTMLQSFLNTREYEAESSLAEAVRKSAEATLAEVRATGAPLSAVAVRDVASSRTPFTLRESIPAGEIGSA